MAYSNKNKKSATWPPLKGAAAVSAEGPACDAIKGWDEGAGLSYSAEIELGPTGSVGNIGQKGLSGEDGITQLNAMYLTGIEKAALKDVLSMFKTDVRALEAALAHVTNERERTDAISKLRSLLTVIEL